ncbi:hypothetical protein GDO81_024196 [Engystomops pustulosus]|uniref:Uncharacterized protein n=1 Tax=Engystomops pustulosus TaxID=76066 RepID=A0AAV6YLS8_ENGPU|nr:hypothetical protein GDO81_024196 [Engystomops pustulosus]
MERAYSTVPWVGGGGGGGSVQRGAPAPAAAPRLVSLGQVQSPPARSESADTPLCPRFISAARKGTAPACSSRRRRGLDPPWRIRGRYARRSEERLRSSGPQCTLLALPAYA